MKAGLIIPLQIDMLRWAGWFAHGTIIEPADPLTMLTGDQLTKLTG